MRIIKFRVYDLKEKKMFYMDNMNNMEWLIYLSAYMHKKSNLILMQYTGRKDASGKEIYEGDILHWMKQRHYVVKWYERGCFGFTDGQSDWHDIEGCDKHEKVGDIYQNPELIYN